jgi:hypothetical protein
MLDGRFINLARKMPNEQTLQYQANNDLFFDTPTLHLIPKNKKRPQFQLKSEEK